MIINDKKWAGKGLNRGRDEYSSERKFVLQFYRTKRGKAEMPFSIISPFLTSLLLLQK